MTYPWVPVPEDKLSFGMWTVGWRGVDVFGGAMRDQTLARFTAALATTNLFSSPVFKDGAFTANDR